MSSKINEQEVRHVAKLARLSCTDEEIGRLTVELGSILEYVGQLQELDTTDVEPLAHCLRISNVFREDEVRASLSSEEALANAPDRDGEYFAVPKVLGDGGA